MFQFIVNFFHQKQNQNEPFIQKRDNRYNVFNEQYRDAYNRLWIQELRDYCP